VISHLGSLNRSILWVSVNTCEGWSHQDESVGRCPAMSGKCSAGENPVGGWRWRRAVPTSMAPKRRRRCPNVQRPPATLAGVVAVALLVIHSGGEWTTFCLDTLATDL
jgi:hypothetical protein